MKFTYTLLLLPLFLLSCEKDCYECPECIFGEWELIEMGGGITGDTWYIDDDVEIEFSEDFILYCYNDNELINEVPYEFVGDLTCGDKSFGLMVKDGNEWIRYFSFNGPGEMTIYLGTSWTKYRRD